MKRPKKKLSMGRGGYLAGVSLLALALVILFNLIVGQLPSNWLEFDLTDNGLYEISDTSREFLSTLDQDVEIVVLAEEGTTDARITKFLDRYTALSSHLSLTYVDPVAHPEEASAYEADSDSLVVRCEATGKSRAIPYSDIITYTYTNYFSVTEDSFDAEGQLTSAVNYVTGDTSAKVYTVSGHGETDLSDPVVQAIEKANLTLSSVTPALTGIPEDCDVLIVNAPATDLSADELEIFETYLSGGGQMIFLAGETLDALPNWETLLSNRGLDLVEGYIADPGSYYPQRGSAFSVCGQLNLSCGLADGLDNAALTMLEYSRGFLSLDTGEEDSWTVTPILSTTSQALAVTQDGTQTNGTYLLGAVSEGDDGGRLTVFGSSSFISGDILTNYPSLANQTLFLNAITAALEGVDNLSISAKSLSVTYNTFQNPGLWSTCFTVILPLGILLAGFIFWLKRRKL